MDSPDDTPAIRDAKRINLDDPREVDAWCVLLKLCEADLRTAVGIVGPMSAAVAVYINSRGRRGVLRQVGEIGHPFERRAQPRGDGPRTDGSDRPPPVAAKRVPTDGK